MKDKNGNREDRQQSDASGDDYGQEGGIALSGLAGGSGFGGISHKGLDAGCGTEGFLDASLSREDRDISRYIRQFFSGTVKAHFTGDFWKKRVHKHGPLPIVHGPLTVSSRSQNRRPKTCQFLTFFLTIFALVQVRRLREQATGDKRAKWR